MYEYFNFFLIVDNQYSIITRIRIYIIPVLV